MVRLHQKFMWVTLALVVACGGEDGEGADARDLTLASADSVAALADTAEVMAVPEDPPAPAPQRPAPQRPAAAPQRPPPAPTGPTLEAGTALTIYAVDTLTSRHNSVGDTIAAVVVEAIMDGRDREVMPVGTIFYGTITDVAPAESPGGRGRMAFAFHRVDIQGTSYAISANVDSLATRMKGRGVTAGDAAKVGAGVVVGAVAGRIIGGNRTGTIVGAAAGAAAGVGIAAATRDVDILLDAGAAVWLVLTEPFVRG